MAFMVKWFSEPPTTDHRPLEQMQLLRFDGKRWVRFGQIFGGSAL